MDRDQLLARLAASQYGVFTRRQARDLRFSEDTIDRRVRSGRWPRVHPGVYVMAGTPRSSEQRLMAACLAAGSAALVSHMSAAALFGLAKAGPSVHITVPAASSPRLAEVQITRSRDLRPTDQCRVDGIPTTRLPRIFLDLAVVVELEALDRMLDDALAARRLSLSQLESRVAAARPGRTGLALLRRLIAERWGEKDPLNGFERSIVRLLTKHGMPPTATQYRLTMPSGRRLRLDAAYPERRFGVEGQSYRWRGSRSGWRYDQGRLAELHAIGWHVLPVTPEDVEERPLWIVGQVALGLSGAASTS